MIDEATPRGRILATTLRLAATKGWAEIALLDIAEAAQVPLSDLRREFNTKTDILAAFVRAVDDEVLRRAPKRAAEQSARDVLFDVIMTRFDVLAPYKAALKSISAAGPSDPALVRPLLSSQHWMLQAAGISTDGPGGALRVPGLAMVYGSVFRVWLNDDDPGLARTMAALDRRLRRGERTLTSVEQVCSTLYRLGTEGPAFLRSVVRRGRPPTDAAAGPEAGAP